MGFSPREIDAMSIWQFQAAVDGYRAAHEPDGDKGLSDTEADELADWIGI